MTDSPVDVITALTPSPKPIEATDKRSIPVGITRIVTGVLTANRASVVVKADPLANNPVAIPGVVLQ